MGKDVEIDQDSQTITAIRQLRKSGGSTVVTIPPEMLDLTELEAGDGAELKAEFFGDEIRLRIVASDPNEGDETHAQE